MFVFKKRVLAYFVAAAGLHAAPQGLSVSHGEIQHSEIGTLTQLSCSDKAILNWDSFSLLENEAALFLQPTTQSVVINRVKGGMPSKILGELSANGRLVLINPQGIFVGNKAIVNTAGFIGSTLDVLDEHILNDHWEFFGDSDQKVVNYGKISAKGGDLYLIGRSLKNRGELKGSYVGLAAGQKILLVPEGNGRISIEVGEGFINDKGFIQANLIEMKANAPEALAIKTSGKLEATKSEERNGRIYLLAEEGVLEVGAKVKASKGECYCLGEKVGLTKEASIDLSSKQGGGNLFVGGSYQGKDPAIFASQLTFVEEGVVIDVSATERGHAGQAIFWSDGFTEMDGFVKATGGREGGNGGFIEVSGLKGFHFGGKTDRSAPLGDPGKLLLDPLSTVTISNSSDLNVSFASGVYTPTNMTVNIQASSLEDELNNGDVDILVLSSGPGAWIPGDGSIAVNADVNWSSTNKLSLRADTSLSITQNITNTSSSTGFVAMDFQANQGVTPNSGNFIGINVSGNVSSVGGDILMTGNSGVTTLGNPGIQITGTISTTSGAVTLNGTSETTSTGNSHGIVNFGLIESTGTANARAISLTGVGAVSSSSTGVNFASNGGITSSSANVNVTGQGSSTGSNNHGVLIEDTSFITVQQNGRIRIEGTGGEEGSGIVIDNGLLSTVNGNIRMTGTSGASDSTTYQGIYLTSGSSLTTTSGRMILNGVSQVTNSPTSAHGIFIEGSTITSTGSTTPKALLLTGTAGTGTDSNGIYWDTSTLSVVDADFIASGTASGGAGGGNAGIVAGGTLTSTGLGNITLTGLGASGGSDNHGISVTGDIGSQISGVTLIGTGGGEGSGVVVDAATVSTVSGALAMTGTSGVSNATAYQGIQFTNGATITTSLGDMTLTGTSQVTNSPASAHGILIEGSTLTSTGSGSAGTLMLTGTSGTGTDSSGIYWDTSTMSVVDADFEATGTASGGSGGGNTGITVDSPLTSTGAGSLLLTGKGGAGGGNNYGIYLLDDVTTTGAGGLTLRGTGGANGTGVQANGATVSTVTGPIAIRGVSGVENGTISCGILLQNSALLTTSLGSMDLFGLSRVTNSSSDANGILFESGSTLSSTGSGDAGILNLRGQGGQGSSCIGVLFDGAAVSVVDGDLVVVGIAGPSSGAGDNIGVYIGSPISSTGQGKISLTGTGGDNGPGDYGLLVFGTITLSGSGSCSLKGTGGANGDTNYGIQIVGDITNSGTGNLEISGFGGTKGDQNYGVFVQDSIASTSSGAITITGVGGDNGDSNIGVYVLDEGISSASGPLTVNATGGTNGVGNYGLFLTGNLGHIESGSGALSITGSSEGRGIFLTDSSFVESTSGAMNLQTFSDILLTENAKIIGGSGTLTVRSSGNLTIVGSSTAAGTTGITVGSGDAFVSAGDNLLLTGGSFANGNAQIGSPTISTSASLTFPSVGGHLLVYGGDTGSYAVIGHGSPTAGAVTFTGDISVQNVGNTITLLGAQNSGGSLGFAQIGHIDSAGSTLGGDINLTCGTSIVVEGGATDADAFARIGHGGHGNSPTLNASTMLLKAGLNIEMYSKVGDAQIVNGSGDLTLVVDNRFPSFPNFGRGRFILNSTLESTGELRIYTVLNEFNTINSLINGQTFVHGTFGVDNPQEQYDIYFPDGTYSTAAFRIYYKLGILFQAHGGYLLSQANVEMSDLLPIFRYMRLPFYPWHHPSLCTYDYELYCDPSFDPYGSFIFEDDLYWIGAAR